ncbi:MAG: hydroxymethylbilane synthase [Microbacterium sp.]|uniref:hydroxymethylbilane synthase n=1 Tax=Microbacterium sp. TaxID=51671 RepID=UPI0039E3C5A2
MTALRLGTRRSALATAQSQQVADALAAAAGRPVELVPIVSEGDVSRASLSTLGGRGVFATRLRDALRAGECDLLVHSLKDLPAAQPDDLVLGAIPPREDARDVCVTRDGTPVHALAAGARVGTGSPRRRAQLRRRNPGVDVRDLRGNVDSRLRRVIDGELDAVILAAAGISRLGDALSPEAAALEPELLGLAEWPTAPGQGALGVETRADADDALLAALAALDDIDTRLAVTAERAVLAGLDAGCSAPVGAHACVDGGTLRVRAVVYSPDGSLHIGSDSTAPLRPTGLAGEGYIRSQGSGNGADAADGDPIARAIQAGSLVAHRLLERGAAHLAPRESHG